METQHASPPKSFLGMSLFAWALATLSSLAIVLLWVDLHRAQNIVVSFHQGFADRLVEHRQNLPEPYLGEVMDSLRFSLRSCAKYSATAFKLGAVKTGEAAKKAARAAGEASFEGCLVKSVDGLGQALTPQARELLLSGLTCTKDCPLPSVPDLGSWPG